MSFCPGSSRKIAGIVRLDHLSIRQEQEGNRPPVCYLETDSQPDVRYGLFDICPGIFYSAQRSSATTVYNLTVQKPAAEN